MPKISVIVPVYKVEPYLHRCVDSILAQTFTDFELILVDDGSPDNCGKICDEYAEKEARVHVIHQENGGLSAARNAGIDWAFANSSSEWLSFVDSDDWVNSKFLSELYAAANNTGSRVSSCTFIRATEFREYAIEPVALEVLQWDSYYLKDPVNGAVAWNKLYEKRLFEKMRYPVGKIHEDEFLTYKVLCQAEKVANILYPLYYYYQNAESIIKRPFSLKRLDGIEALNEQRAFFKTNNYQALYYSRTREVFRRSQLYKQKIKTLEEQDLITKRAIRRLNVLMRSILRKDGKALFPKNENRWLYDQAFPVDSWLYWTARGIINKVKKVVGNG